MVTTEHAWAWSLDHRRRTAFGVIVWGLACIPPALALAGVIRYGVDVPVGDQWTLARMFQAVQLNAHGAAALFSQANEARPAVPRLLFMAMAQFGYWNVKHEMLATQGVLWLTSVGLLHLARRETRATWIATGTLALLVNALLFSWSQYENFLWGNQLMLYFPLVCLTYSCHLALGPWPFPRVAIVTMALSILATYSFANGMLLWPLTAAVLAATRRAEIRRHWVVTALWVAAAALAMGFYFWGFAWSPEHPSWSAAATDPLKTVAGLLVFIGSGFSVSLLYGDHRPLIAAGAAVVIVLTLTWLAVCAFTNRDQRALFGCGVIAFALAGYGVGSAAITVVGRIGFGLEYLLASRYIAFSSAVLLSVVILFWAFLVSERRSAAPVLNGFVTHLAVAMVAGFSVMLVLANVQSNAHVLELRRTRLQARAILPFVRVANERDVRAVLSNPGSEAVWRVLPELVEAGVLPNLRAELTWSSAPPNAGAATFGRVEDVRRRDDGSLLATGWTFLPDQRRSGDAVLLTTMEEEGVRRPLAVVVPNTPRDDVVLLTGASRAFRSGWRLELPASRADGLEFWTLDGKTNQAYELFVNN